MSVPNNPSNGSGFNLDNGVATGTGFSAVAGGGAELAGMQQLTVVMFAIMVIFASIMLYMLVKRGFRRAVARRNQ